MWRVEPIEDETCNLGRLAQYSADVLYHQRLDGI